MTQGMLLFQTAPDAPRWKRWLLYSALARIVIFVALMALAVTAVTFAFGVVGFSPKESLAPGPRSILRFAVQAACAVIAYLILVRFIERRRPVELSLRPALRETAVGLAFGAILITSVIAVLWVAGAYRVAGTDPAADWVVPLLTGGIGAAISEEIIFRGVVYRICEEGMGTIWALAISSVFFGLVHLGNEGSTAWSAAAIAIEAGLLLGLVYHVTRSLWVCIGLHAGWNFFQGYVWGVPVSGTDANGFITAVREGPDWLTGGAWGAEGSVVAVLLNFAVAVVLLEMARRRKTLVPLRRKHAPIMEAAPAA